MLKLLLLLPKSTAKSFIFIFFSIRITRILFAIPIEHHHHFRNIIQNPPLAAAFLWLSVWARRSKPTRPARAEHPPLSLGSPYAAQPQDSRSPDFPQRVATHRRGGAGRKQNVASAWLLAGVPVATRALKVSIFLVRGRSPQRHRGCCEAVNYFHAARKVA